MTPFGWVVLAAALGGQLAGGLLGIWLSSRYDRRRDRNR